MLASHVSGGIKHDDSALAAILSYNPDMDQWSTAGSMREMKHSHAVMKVNTEEYAPYCQ